MNAWTLSFPAGIRLYSFIESCVLPAITKVDLFLCWFWTWKILPSECLASDHLILFSIDLRSNFSWGRISQGGLRTRKRETTCSWCYWQWEHIQRSMRRPSRRGTLSFDDTQEWSLLMLSSQEPTVAASSLLWCWERTWRKTKRMQYSRSEEKWCCGAIRTSHHNFLTKRCRSGARTATAERAAGEWLRTRGIILGAPPPLLIENQHLSSRRHPLPKLNDCTPCSHQHRPDIIRLWSS